MMDRVWGCGLDHGGRCGVWIRSWARVWGCGLDHGAGCEGVD